MLFVVFIRFKDQLKIYNILILFLICGKRVWQNDVGFVVYRIVVLYREFFMNI